MARKLVVEIVGDTDALEKSYRRAQKSTDQFGRSIDRTGRTGTSATVAFSGLGRAAVGAGVAFVGVQEGLRAAADVTRQSIGAASDLNEQLSKSRVVFGTSAKSIIDWSKTTAGAFGISRREALGTASSFGALFRPLGLTGKVAADQSRALTELGADLASFYNTDVQSALDAIRSGLVGESEPLRQYGVLLSESRVQAQAMADTGKRTAASLTNQEKALARIKIIFEDTSVAQGDFARTSDGLANQTRVLQANLDNLETELGQKLIPVLSDATTYLNAFLGEMDNSTGSAGTFISAVGAAGDAVGWLTGKLAGLARAGVKDAIPGGRNLFPLLTAVRDISRGPSYTKQKDETDRLAILKRDRGLALQAAVLATAADRANQKAADAARKLAQRRGWFDALISRREDRVQDIRTLQGQLDELHAIAALIEQKMAATNDITRRLNLSDTLADVHRRERSVLDQMKQATQDAIDQRKELAQQRQERAKERREAMVEARNARQFLALGLGPTGGALVPQLANLRKRRASLVNAIKGTALDTKSTRSLFARIGKILAEGPNRVSVDVRAAIDRMFDDIRAKLNEGAASFRTAGGRGVSVSKFVAGLGLTLSPADKLRLQQGLASASGFTVPRTTAATPTGTGATSGVVIGSLNLFGIQNLRQLESEIVRRSKSRPQPRRGGR